jgi:mRNA-degrading endonuclease RelE of RelBE toxin-antitoxin system
MIMYRFIFTHYAKKRFDKLDANTRERIKTKLLELKKYPNILPLLKPLSGLKPATHRLRIGDFRIILKYCNKCSYILDVGHRKNIYK